MWFDIPVFLYSKRVKMKIMSNNEKSERIKSIERSNEFKLNRKCNFKISQSHCSHRGQRIIRKL